MSRRKFTIHSYFRSLGGREWTDHITNIYRYYFKATPYKVVFCDDDCCCCIKEKNEFK